MERQAGKMSRFRKTALFAIVVALLCTAVSLAGCGGSGGSLKSEEVSVGDCSVKFTGYRWDDGKDWGKKSDYAVFVLSCTVTNNGNSPVRPADHFLVRVAFEGRGTGQGNVNTLRVEIPSGNEEIAPGESAEVLLYDTVDVGRKKSYYDGCMATAEWGWADDLSGVNLGISQEAYQAFENLDEVHTLPLGQA